MPPKRKRAAKSSKRVKKSRSKDARSFLDSEAAEESGYVSSCDRSKYVGSKLSKITIEDCSTLSYFLYCGKKWVAISSSRDVNFSGCNCMNCILALSIFTFFHTLGLVSTHRIIYN